MIEEKIMQTYYGGPAAKQIKTENFELTRVAEMVNDNEK